MELDNVFKENMGLVEFLEESINIRQVITKDIDSIQANTDDIQSSSIKAAIISRNMECDELNTMRQYFIDNIATITDEQVTRLKVQLDHTISAALDYFTTKVIERVADLRTQVVALQWDIRHLESRHKTIKNSLTYDTSNNKDTEEQKTSK